ncbi:MAG: SCO family protein [Proteobacteria bacterium]|nr:SCO family protein [Pseudomonadota bacterium]
MENTLPRPKNNFTEIFESKAFWFIVVFTLFSLPLIMSFRKKAPENLPVLGQLSDFKLTNQDGRQITLREFQGTVTVVNFIFTSCPDVCPLMTQQMAKIQERLKGTAKSIQLVSISVDPTHDTPEVLKAYGTKFHSDFKLWTFLTGPMPEIKKLVVDGFKTALDGKPNPDPEDYSGLMDITHSEYFVLVDQASQIRAYRTAKTEEDLNRIVRELAILVNTFPQKPATLPEAEKKS